MGGCQVSPAGELLTALGLSLICVAVGNTRGHSVTRDGACWRLGALGRSAAANPYKLLNYKQNL